MTLFPGLLTKISRLGASSRSLSKLSSDLEKTREFLSKFPGGSVDLVKNESNGIATITLNNPNRKNALTGSMMVQLADKITELESWKEGKGLLLTGAQGTFCSGGDLDFVKNVLTGEQGFKMSTFMHDTTTRLVNLPMISVAVIQGSAVGGGAELTTACDFRAMLETSRIGFVNVKMGVITGFGGGTRLTKILGRRKALNVLCSGRVFKADDAKELGLADVVIPESTSDMIDHVTKWLLTNYCRWSPELIQRVKKVTLGAEELDTETALAEELALFSQVWGGPLQKAAIAENLKH